MWPLPLQSLTGSEAIGPAISGTIQQNGAWSGGIPFAAFSKIFISFKLVLLKDCVVLQGIVVK